MVEIISPLLVATIRIFCHAPWVFICLLLLKSCLLQHFYVWCWEESDPVSCEFHKSPALLQDHHATSQCHYNLKIFNDWHPFTTLTKTHYCHILHFVTTRCRFSSPLWKQTVSRHLFAARRFWSFIYGTSRPEQLAVHFLEQTRPIFNSPGGTPHLLLEVRLPQGLQLLRLSPHLGFIYQLPLEIVWFKVGIHNTTIRSSKPCLSTTENGRKL